MKKRPVTPKKDSNKNKNEPPQGCEEENEVLKALPTEEYKIR